MLLDKRRQDYATHFDWYDGRLETLFNAVAPTSVNGLLLVPAAQISSEFNYFAAVSRFYSDAMLGDLPDMADADADLINQLAEHWAVTGEACIVENPDGIRAIRPDYVFPEFDPYDRDIVRRFRFIFPERDPDKDPGQLNRVGYATSARVIEYDTATGQAWLGNRQFASGWIADEPRGAPVNIGNVFWINTNDGVYPQMSGIVREITIRLNIMQKFLNSVSQSILQIDTDAIAGGALERGVTPARVNAVAEQGLGLTVTPPFVGEAEARYVERGGQGLTESLEYLRMLLGQLGVISGVPDYVFGVQLGRPANETERVLFTGQSKVNRFRRDIERVFGLLGREVKFASEPFVTRSERQTAILAQYSAGVATLDETRAALGYPPMVDDQPPVSDGNAMQRVINKVRGQ